MPLSLNDVLAKFPPNVLDRYDFTNAQYHGALERMTGVVCREHGEFTQYPAQLRKGGSGCPQCGDVIRRAKRRSPQEAVIAAAIAKHDGFYTYERTVYVNNATKFTVTCPLHGDFKVAPNNHISGGRGCPVCGAVKRGHRVNVVEAARKTADTKLETYADAFERDARSTHGTKYDYSEVIYRGRNTKVRICCPAHGVFLQKPYQHIARAQGCPECSHHRSKGEAELLAFVSTFGPASTRNRAVIAPKELDIWVPWANVAIEYCGEYWHSAKDADEESFARRRHKEKLRLCEAAGIRLLTVYESEWRDRKPVIKRLIRNALGKGRGRIMARQCSVGVVGLAEAAAFFERYHPQGGGGWGQVYGLRYGGKLVACMRFTFGANDRGAGATRMWTLTRDRKSVV